MIDVLDRRSLNRATLARQHLLDRVDRPATEVVAGLVGLQGQDGDQPYYGLWSRVAGFRAGELVQLLHERRVVRAMLMRGTQHLVVAEDWLAYQQLFAPLLARQQRSAFGRHLVGVNPDELLAAARDAIGDGGITRPELGAVLAQRWPGRPPAALARTAQHLLAVLHPPPDGVWGQRGHTPFALGERWLGQAPLAAPSASELVLRYLAAFGPATTADVRAWSGLTGLQEILDGLRLRLRTFRDEAGRELHDLPDAPRPDPDTPAPVRFLACFDNVVLGHHDRSRVVADDRRSHTATTATLTVDGFVRGLWRIDRGTAAATLGIRLFAPLSTAESAAVTEEGTQLLTFAAPETADRWIATALLADAPASSRDRAGLRRAGGR